MASWEINKGVGRTVEFKGLKAQYLFLFAGGLLATFLLVNQINEAWIQEYLNLARSQGLTSIRAHSLPNASRSRS